MLSGMQQIVEMARSALARILSNVSIVQMLNSERIVPSWKIKFLLSHYGTFQVLKQ